MKTNYRKLVPKIISYRFYAYYTNEKFSQTFISKLSKVFIENNDKGLDRLLGVCKETHNIYAPFKKSTKEAIIFLL